MSGWLRKRTYLRTNDRKPHYDVVIIGAGGHGLATAYYLASKFGITNVAVIERSYIGSGGTGRNTTILRANYKTPSTIRFFKACPTPACPPCTYVQLLFRAPTRIRTIDRILAQL